MKNNSSNLALDAIMAQIRKVVEKELFPEDKKSPEDKEVSIEVASVKPMALDEASTDEDLLSALMNPEKSSKSPEVEVCKTCSKEECECEKEESDEDLLKLLKGE